MRIVRRNITFVRSILTMLSGSMFARLITISVAPVISRLFDPDDIGLAAIFTALVFLLTTVATLRFDQAIVIADSDGDASGLARLTTLILTGFSAFFLVLAIVLFALDVPLGRYSSLGSWLVLVPVGVFLTGLTEVFRSRVIRKKRFARVAQSEIVFATGSATARIGGGLALGSLLSTLVVGHLLGVLARLLFLNFEFRRDPAENPVTKTDLLRLSREHRQFPMFATPTAFLRTLSENMPVLAFGILYAPAIVGFYAFAHRLVGLPAALINRAIRQVFLQKIAEIHSAGRRTRGALVKTTFVLMLVGILPTVVLLLYGEPIFELLLGQRWAAAGQYAEIISPWLLLTVASAPASVTYIVYRQQKRLLRIHFVLTALRIGIFFVAYLQGLEVKFVLVLLSASGVAGYLWIIATAWAIAGGKRAETAGE